MLKLEELDKHLAITYRSHNILKDGNKYFCQDCKQNLWDDNFPEFCIGPTTILNLGKVSSLEENYNLEAKLFHIHGKTLIEFLTFIKLSENFSLELSKDELKGLIEKLNKVLEIL